MPAITGPARYVFLRRAHGGEDVPRWPPKVTPFQWPENVVATGVRLGRDEIGWRVEAIDGGDAPQTDPTGGLWFSRATAFGRIAGGRPNHAVFELLGARLVRPEEKGPEYASHLIVRLSSGGAWGMPKEAVVVPMDAMVIGGYFERRGQVDVATFDLRLTNDEVALLQPYLPDSAIQRLAEQALDVAVPNPRQRHDMLVEVESGRVALHGSCEFSSTGDAARAELERTPGVIEVVDHMQYDEDILSQVTEALAAKGLGALDVLTEHNLVSLHGVVPDRATAYKARDIALKIPGVRGVVINQVLIQPEQPVQPTRPSRPTSTPILPSANDRSAMRAAIRPEEPRRNQNNGQKPNQRQKGDLAKSRS
jgi:osmotically-inducible protein OsmY